MTGLPDVMETFSRCLAILMNLHLETICHILYFDQALGYWGYFFAAFGTSTSDLSFS